MTFGVIRVTRTRRDVKGLADLERERGDLERGDLERGDRDLDLGERERDEYEREEYERGDREYEELLFYSSQLLLLMVSL